MSEMYSTYFFRYQKKLLFLLLFFIFSLSSVALKAQQINWVSLKKAQELAARQDKKVMIFAEADWCPYCKQMHKEVFPKESVQDSLKKYFYAVSIDIESDEKVTFNGETFTQQSLSRKFRVSGTPTTIFVDSNGDILGTQPGFLASHIYDKLLAYVGAERYNKQSFKDYLDQLGIKINR